ncbi:MAG TPA: filamentous hemagglutinin N-terminal domain-containing protein [Ramlibacter sp.]|uniref:beta strand repeat-containing protein n=1 Tax=Ramlibacter sp. TaxID=1917967 RepID=UPI002ED61746
MSRQPVRPAVAGFRPHAAAAAVAAAFVLQPALAQPVGGQAVQGQASFTSSGSNLVVRTQNGIGTSHSTINWQSFSVPAGSTTQFIQPSITSTSINRVLGPDPSAIFGTLTSNGRLVLVNPAGITVGAGGVVDAPGFIASTLRMSDADAIAGRLLFQGGTGAALQVDGKILARSGDVVLVGTNVQTGPDALVQADGGAVVLAAGHKVALTGRGLEGIQLEVQAGNEARNLGTLQGDAVGVFAHTLRHSGLVAANAVSTEGGKVVLKAIGGDALVDGTVIAKAGDKGGSIDVFGERVALQDGAKLDASGRTGGGQVRVGGDYQGRNPEVPNAKRTFVAATATIHADATEQGDGGKVIVWADEAAGMHGTITARGGAQGGNGGFVEVSGKQALQFTGSVDTRAPRGRSGTLLLDPNDIVIDTDNNVSVTDTSQGAVFSGGPALSYIRESDLERALGSGSVIVATNGSAGGNGDITVASGVNVQWSNTNALGLQSDRNINLLGSFTASDATGSAVLSLHAINGNITQDSTTSVIQVPRLQVNVDNGSAVMLGNNLVSTLGANMGGVGNLFQFHNAQALSIGNVVSPYGRAGNGIDAIDAAGNKGSVTVLAAGKLAIDADVSGGTLDLEGSTVTVASGVTVSSAGGTGLLIDVTGTGAHDIAGTLVSDGYVDIGGNGSFSVGNIRAPNVFFFGGSDGVTPTTVTQKSGTAIEAGTLFASVTNAPGSGLTFFNAGNKIDSVSVSATGDVFVSSANNLDVGAASGTNVKLQAPNIGMGVESSIFATGNVWLRGTGGASTIDIGPGYVSAGGNLDFANAGNVTLGTIDAGSMTANLAGSLTQDALNSSYVNTPGGIAASVKGSISLPGNPASSFPNVLGYVSGSAGGNILMNGVRGVATAGLSAGGDISLTADTGARPAALTAPSQLLASVPTATGTGDLDVQGSVTAGNSIALTSGTNVVVQDTATLTAPSISLVAPLTTVFGTLQPGGAGGIGTVRASGDLFFGATGTMQFDVASLSVFDRLVAGGTVSTATTTALQVVDRSGGTLAGSFSPVSAGQGSDIAFTVPANWFVTPITTVSPYIITAGAPPAPAPAPAPVPTTTATGDALQVNDQLVTFARLFVQEAERQDEVKRIGKDDIVVTDTGCRPQ